MADTQILREYLVNLGFQVSNPELRKFEDALRITGQQAEKFTTGIARSFTAAGASVIGVLTGISTGVLALADNVARQDLEMQIWARRMFLSADAARQMKIAADALGFSLEDIVWGPKELQERYAGLVAEQKKLDEGMGGTAYIEDRLKRIRDLRNEFTKIQVAVTEGSRGLAASLYDKIFGGAQGEERLAKFNNFVDRLINDTPRIVSELSDALAPTLENVWQIWTKLYDIAEKTTGAVLKFIGAIYGDRQLEQGAVSIENIGKALDHVSSTLLQIVTFIDKIVNLVASHPILAKTLGGALAGAALAAPTFNPGLIGGAAALGGAAGLIAGVGDATGAFTTTDTQKKAIWGGLSSEAARVANQISGVTGIPAALLYGQFAHETGQFTNRGATQLNNLAGIELPGGGDYRKFASLDDFAQYYERLIESPRYRGALSAKTPEDFAAALKAGGYYEDTYENYAAGIRRYAPEYHPTSGSASIDVGGITVNVTHPNATPEQIHQAVTSAVQESMDKQVARNIIQLSGSYA
jgi:hypothetical protein